MARLGLGFALPCFVGLFSARLEPNSFLVSRPASSPPSYFSAPPPLWLTALTSAIHEGLQHTSPPRQAVRRACVIRALEPGKLP
jgi:hypothetical protein